MPETWAACWKNLPQEDTRCCGRLPRVSAGCCAFRETAEIPGRLACHKLFEGSVKKKWLLSGPVHYNSGLRFSPTKTVPQLPTRTLSYNIYVRFSFARYAPYYCGFRFSRNVRTVLLQQIRPVLLRLPTVPSVDLHRVVPLHRAAVARVPSAAGFVPFILRCGACWSTGRIRVAPVCDLGGGAWWRAHHDHGGM